MALTERQQEIQDLVRQGKSAKEIAQALGISENAVYQHRRRMRGGQPAAKSTAGRQSTRQTASPAATSESRPTATAIVTPERALRDEKTDLERQIKEFDAEVGAAQKALEQATAKRDAGVAKITTRLTNVSTALDALSGNANGNGKAAPQKPATDAQKPASGAKRTGKAPKVAEAPSVASAPEPVADAEPDTSLAEADAAQSAAETPEPAPAAA